MTPATKTVLDRLRELGPPEARLPDEAGVVDPLRDGAPSREQLRLRAFVVAGRERRIVAPADWRQDPWRSRSWRYVLHTLTWLRPVLAWHAVSGDGEALEAASEVVVDWCRQHMGERASADAGGDGEVAGDGAGRGGGPASEFAWYDMAVGLRAPYLAYVLRAGLHAGQLRAEDAELLLAAAERHGSELADAGRYAAGHNHGLYQDAGLYLLARQLPAIESAAGWRELALDRLRTTLAETVSLRDGAHLEHSTAYQFALVNLLAEVVGPSMVADERATPRSPADAAPDREEAELADTVALLARMRRTAAWQVTPSGRLAQLGDTDDQPAPAWARDTAPHLSGCLTLFEAGQAFVRDGASFLAVTAAHHGPAHKHADDTGLLLVEDGHVVLGDAGRWGYYETDPDRVYARSSRAHNVLAVDGADLDWRWTHPYGSGLEAAGAAGGWYAFLTSNRLLAQQGVAHRRLVLYRPATMLLVVDEVRADRPHDYARRFHFGRDLHAEIADGRVALSGEDVFAAELADLDGHSDASTSLARGRDEPQRLGWTYPGDRERAPVWTATLAARARDATFAAALWLDGEEPTVAGIELERSAATVDLGPSGALELRFDGRRIAIS